MMEAAAVKAPPREPRPPGNWERRSRASACSAQTQRPGKAGREQPARAVHSWPATGTVRRSGRRGARKRTSAPTDERPALSVLGARLWRLKPSPALDGAHPHEAVRCQALAAGLDLPGAGQLDHCSSRTST